MNPDLMDWLTERAASDVSYGVMFEKTITRITKLEAELSKFQESSFNPDYSMLEACQESLREHMARIKELERALDALRNNYLDECDENAKLEDQLAALKAQAGEVLCINCMAVAEDRVIDRTTPSTPAADHRAILEQALAALEHADSREGVWSYQTEIENLRTAIAEAEKTE